MSKNLKTNKIIAFILILSLIWSDFAFCVQGLISIAEENVEPQVNLELTQEAVKKCDIIDSNNEEIGQELSGKTMIQFKVKLDVLGEIENYSSKESMLEIDLAEYSDKTEKVEVISKNADFSDENWEYDFTQKKIKITEKNDIENSLECYINYYFSELINAEAIPFNVNAKATLTIGEEGEGEGEENEREVSLEKENELSLQDIDNKFITSEINSSISELDKGYMYANLKKQDPIYTTKYDFVTTLNISCNENIENIKIKDNKESLNSDEEEFILSNEGYATYNTIRISKKEIEKILGEEGYIKILDNEGYNLATISKDGLKYSLRRRR